MDPTIPDAINEVPHTLLWFGAVAVMIAFLRGQRVTKANDERYVLSSAYRERCQDYDKKLEDLRRADEAERQERMAAEEREREARHKLADDVTKSVVPEIVALRSGLAATKESLAALHADTQETNKLVRALVEKLIK